MFCASMQSMFMQFFDLRTKFLTVDILQGINHVYYDTEFRTEWCRNNSTLVPCFLFARKFSEGAAMRLLIEGVIGQLNTTKLME